MLFYSDGKRSCSFSLLRLFARYIITTTNSGMKKSKKNPVLCINAFSILIIVRITSTVRKAFSALLLFMIR